MQHQAGKGHEVQPRQDLRQPLIVPGEPAEARGPGEATLDDPALGQQDEATIGVRQLDHSQADAMGGRCVGWLLARVPLVDVGQLDGLASDLLHGRRQGVDLGPVLRVGWGEVQREQVVQRVDGGVDLRAVAPLVPVIAGACATLGRRLECAAFQDRRRRLARSTLGQAQQGAQIVDDGCEDAGLQPAPCLLVDRFPAREVVGQQAPFSARAGQPAQGVEDIP